MGDVYDYNKSKKRKGPPRWYCRYVDIDGKRQNKPTHQRTHAEAVRFLAEIEGRVARGLIGIPSRDVDDGSPRMGALIEKWVSGLRNRNAANDRNAIGNHLLPAFTDRRLSEMTLRAIMDWLDQQRATGELAEATIRANLNLLSRFFAWAIERGHTATNPVRQIPMGKRPRPSAKSDVPWIDDDATVRRLLSELPEPINLMFYLGNRSALRTGEIAGLRLSDLGFLGEGVLRVRFSYDGPLKEDKAGEGKVKWVPAAEDAAAVLAPWLARRRAEGAGPEDLVFVAPRGGCMNKMLVGRYWRAAAVPHGLRLTWYQATRHSFVSRNLARDAPLDEVSAALGHSSPVVTRRYYDHFVRRRYSSALRSGLGLDAAPAKGEIASLDAAATERRTLTRQDPGPASPADDMNA